MGVWDGPTVLGCTQLPEIHLPLSPLKKRNAGGECADDQEWDFHVDVENRIVQIGTARDVV